MGPARCWRCFHLLSGHSVCPLCGAPAVASESAEAAEAAVDTAEPEAMEPAPLQVVPPVAASVAEAESDEPGPDLSPVDDMWEEEHVARRRWRRRGLLTVAVIVGALVVTVAAWRPWSSSPPP